MTNSELYIKDVIDEYGNIINTMINGIKYFVWLNRTINRTSFYDADSSFLIRLLTSNIGDWNNIEDRERILINEAMRIRNLLENRQRFTRDIYNYYSKHAFEEQDIKYIIHTLTEYIEPPQNEHEPPQIQIQI